MSTVIQADFLFLSASEAAEALGLTDARIRQLCIAGELHGKKLGAKNWAIPAAEIERYRLFREDSGRSHNL